MERYLITQSLLSSWAYTFNCAEGCEDDAQNEFFNAINRIPKETTPEMQNGIDFENEVYRAAAGIPRNPHEKWEDGIQKIAAIIRGAPVQVKASREIEVCGMNFLMYGILDALKAGTIYDVKFMNKSMGGGDSGPYLAGKYLESAQHPAYFYIVPEAIEFRYLVSDGTDLYIETYPREQTRNIADFIANFIPSIEMMGLLPLYKEKWLVK